ncbi:MAG: hypothetical protein MR763_11465 [Clostridiales bacterium]|nr:hypothetical protein [Clostridiales bacterium]
MTISEKSAYLKGLMDGLKLSTESDEGKMIAAMVDLLGDMARKITDIEDTTIAISDELDEIEEDLDAIEDFIMDEDEDDDDFYDDYEDDEDDEDDESWDDEDEEFEEGFDFGDEDSTIYEVECACGNIIDFDEETLEKGSIVCPNCGETLEFSVEDVEE